MPNDSGVRSRRSMLLTARSKIFFSSRGRHTRYWREWSSEVCSSDLGKGGRAQAGLGRKGEIPQLLLTLEEFHRSYQAGLEPFRLFLRQSLGRRSTGLSLHMAQE